MVNSQNHAAHISLVGDYTHSTFNLYSDGHAGTLVIDPPVNGFDCLVHPGTRGRTSFSARRGCARAMKGPC